MEKIEYTVLNIRMVPKEVALAFKAKCAMADQAMQNALILLMQAVVDGQIKLDKLVKTEKKEDA